MPVQDILGRVAVEHSDAVPWLVAAGIVLAAWAVLFAIVASATMPRLPGPGPETMDLGSEPPAIANLLVNRCRLTTSAVSATLVDLAARRHVTIDRIGDDENLVRLLRQGRDAPNSYEAKVLELVRSRVKEQTVPATELSLGYGKDAERWWESFEHAVIDEARDLQLVRRRFAPTQSGLLAGTLAVPFALAGIGFEVYGAAERAAGSEMDVGGGLSIAAVLWFAVLLIGGARLRGWRETRAGSEATARWLGVRNFLRHHEGFRETPPAGVVIWERMLAYGVALGAAHGTDAALPIGPTRDDEGWSPYGGLWRQVRISYPKRFGYGQSPRRAALMSVLVLIAAFAFGFVLARDMVPSLIDVTGDIGGAEGSIRWLLVLLIAVLGAPVAFIGVQIVGRLITLGRALSDLGQTQTFEGYVVRVPWHYVRNSDGERSWVPTGYTAVDDGSGDEVRALRYYRSNIREGQVVRVTLTPRMRHVVSIEAVPDPHRAANSGPGSQGRGE